MGKFATPLALVVAVEFLPGTLSQERIAQTIGEAGYEARAGEAAPDEGRERHRRELTSLKRDLSRSLIFWLNSFTALIRTNMMVIG